MQNKKEWIAGRLRAAGIESAAFEAAQLCTLAEAQIPAALEKRLAGVPLQYILGEWEFYGLTFYVGQGVLIPRPDTEILVEQALRFLKDRPGANVLELCAGSGCVAVTIAKYADAAVTAVELSPQAFCYLQKNIALHGVPVQAVQGDLFAGVAGAFDLILANPPYIRTGELDQLSNEVKHEPMLALDGGADGLRFYRAIAEQYRSNLAADGALLLEIGYDQRESVSAILAAAGYRQIRCFKDYGGNDRVVIARQ